MKKLLITAIIILLIILTGITMIKGINVGKLSVLGIKDIKKEDEQLNTTIQQATKLASTDYQKKINDLNDQIKKLENEKQEYVDNNYAKYLNLGKVKYTKEEMKKSIFEKINLLSIRQTDELLNIIKEYLDEQQI